MLHAPRPNLREMQLTASLNWATQQTEFRKGTIGLVAQLAPLSKADAVSWTRLTAPMKPCRTSPGWSEFGWLLHPMPLPMHPQTS